MALCLLYHARSLPLPSTDADTDADGDPAQADIALMRKRLVQQSYAYYQRAVEGLCALSGGDSNVDARQGQLDATTVRLSSSSLQHKLLALYDLFVHQVESHGASAGYAVLLLSDLFIIEERGPRPVIDLSPDRMKSMDATEWMLVFYAVTDLCRALASVEGPRRALFDFASSSSSSSSSPSSTVPPQPSASPPAAPYTSLFGIPLALLPHMLRIGNLASEESTLPRNEYLRQAHALERAFSEWVPADADAEDKDPNWNSNASDRLATQVMVVNACLIYLYQLVFHYGPLQKKVRSALRKIMDAGSGGGNFACLSTPSTTSDSDSDTRATSIPTPTPTPTPAATHAEIEIEIDLGPGVHKIVVPHTTIYERAPAWFLAATVAVDEQDRQVCQARMREVKPPR